MHFKEAFQATVRLSNLTRINTRLRAVRETQVNPPLIPLLRSLTTMNTPAPISEVNVPFLKDDLAPIRGIIFSLVLILPVWGAVAVVLWVVLR